VNESSRIRANVKAYLVVDLEATTSNDDSLPKDEMETIEIGAVLVDAHTLEPMGEFQSFVRPVRHPVLTPFCTELTQISQAMVDGAPLFPEALTALCSHTLGERTGVVFASWGKYDMTQLQRDCALHRIPYPMPEHLNLKEELSLVHGQKKRFGMARALAFLGLPLEGTHHRGIDDARNIARMLPWIVGGKRLAR